MEVCLKKKFIPETQVEGVDINTTLFIFLQIVSENVNTKKLLVNYLKKDDGGCIFDGIKDLLKTVSIELELVPMQREDFYSFSMVDDEPPHIVYIDDLLADRRMTQALVNTVPPSCFVINREVDVQSIINKDVYYPLYATGKGKDKLELSRWNVKMTWTLIESKTRINIAAVRSESDLEEFKKSLKATTIYNQLIFVSKYPDAFGLKQMILDHRMAKNENYAFLVLTNSEVDEKTVKSRLKADLALSILNDGVWGGEYYVPE